MCSGTGVPGSSWSFPPNLGARRRTRPYCATGAELSSTRQTTLRPNTEYSLSNAGRAVEEVPALGDAQGELCGPPVRGTGGFPLAGLLQQVARTASTRWCPASPVAASSSASSSRPARGRGPWHRDDPVERDHRPGRHAASSVVEGEDLRPVGVLGARRLVVDGGDRGLHLVRADRARGQRAGDQRDALGDRRGVPARCGPARRAGRGRRRRLVRAGRRASVSSISASSPATSPSSGSSRVQLAGQPDGLGGQLDAVQRGARSWPCSPR